MATKTKKKLLYIFYAILVLLTVLALIFAIHVQVNKAEAGKTLADSLGPVFVIILYVILFPAVLLVEFEVFYAIKYFMLSPYKTTAQTVINLVCLALPALLLGVLFLLTEYTFAGNVAGVIYFLWLGAHLLFRLLYLPANAVRIRRAVQEQEAKNSSNTY